MKEPLMASDFRLPGFRQPLDAPDAFVSAVLRNFREASQALGVATDALVVRLAGEGGNPDYQFETLDGEDAAAFSGERHDFLYDDITRRIDEKALQDQGYSADQVQDWLNAINGEGRGGGEISEILTEGWTERDAGDPRD
jgi:hypothetical protein